MNIFCHGVPSCVTVCLRLMAHWSLSEFLSPTLWPSFFIPSFALPFVVEWIYQRPKLIVKISTPNAAHGERNSNTTSKPVTCVMHMLYITKGKERTNDASSKAKINSVFCFVLSHYSVFMLAFLVGVLVFGCTCGLCACCEVAGVTSACRTHCSLF